MKPKNDKDYKTIQIRGSIKDQIATYCDIKGLKIGRYIELLFLKDISGSVV